LNKKNTGMAAQTAVPVAELLDFKGVMLWK